MSLFHYCWDSQHHTGSDASQMEIYPGAGSGTRMMLSETPLIRQTVARKLSRIFVLPKKTICVSNLKL